MRPRLEEPVEPDRLVLVVDGLDVRSRRKPAPVRRDELETSRERPLRGPGGVAVDDAAVDEEHAGTGHRKILENRHEVGDFAPNDAALPCYKLDTTSGILARPMQAASPSSFEPAGAGGLLLGVLVACIGTGVLIGWAAGSAGLGALGGAVAGIPGGIFAVYRRYRGVV